MYPTPKNTFIIYPNQIPLLLPVFPRLLSLWHVRKLPRTLAINNITLRQIYIFPIVAFPICFTKNSNTM